MVVCDEDSCMYCGGCVAVCTEDAITVYENRIVIDLECCIDCGNCTTVCPVGAMRIS